MAIPTKKITVVYKVTLEIPETMSRIAIAQELHQKFTIEASLVGTVDSASSHCSGDYDADI